MVALGDLNVRGWTIPVGAQTGVATWIVEPSSSLSASRALDCLSSGPGEVPASPALSARCRRTAGVHVEATQGLRVDATGRQGGPGEVPIVQRGMASADGHRADNFTLKSTSRSARALPRARPRTGGTRDCRDGGPNISGKVRERFTARMLVYSSMTRVPLTATPQATGPTGKVHRVRAGSSTVAATKVRRGALPRRRSRAPRSTRDLRGRNGRGERSSVAEPKSSSSNRHPDARTARLSGELLIARYRLRAGLARGSCRTTPPVAP